MPFSNGSEALIIDQLRKDGDLTISLVVEMDNHIVGHIAFSPVTINNMHNAWYGLGPISVRPELQRTGLGTKLVNAGLSQLKTISAAGCALIGDPAYYYRFGFQSDGKLHYAGVPDPNVQWLSFSSKPASGLLKFASAFERKY